MFCEGDRSDFVVVIVEGRVKVLVTTAEGGEAVLGVRGPGALVGELAAFDRGPRVATAVALEPLTVRLLSADEFRAFVADEPGAGLQLVGMLIGRLREADRRRAEFGTYDAFAWVAASRTPSILSAVSAPPSVTTSSALSTTSLPAPSMSGSRRRRRATGRCHAAGDALMTARTGDDALSS